MALLNLGILAHVDAGKTSLTERLLYDAGELGTLGSVDAGSTRTDSLDMERRRGITIRAAVASFRLPGVTVNLIDTPGHPDFIAEVERALSVLDGAILVVSAVEGVQAHTHVLLRTLRRLGLPTLFFINKTDRSGARPDEVRAQLSELWDRPVRCGSAITGDGIDGLTHAITTLLPYAPEQSDAPLNARVFKIERVNGERIAYARIHAGTLHVRDRLAQGRVTGLRVFDRVVRSATAGHIAVIRGLRTVRVGDQLGDTTGDAPAYFAPPTLESVVVAEDRGAVYAALAQLAEQDPLIGLRRDPLSVTLYGEVQQEVIAGTLAEEYGLHVRFSKPRIISVERVTGVGEHTEVIGAGPFLATIGLRVEPGSGFGIEVEPGSMPAAFFTAVEQSVREGLSAGPHGWQVLDARVTLIRNGYLARQSHSHGTFDKSMSSTAGDFRQLTRLVLAAALARAGTRVCEPVHHLELELPADTLPAVLPVLAALGGTVLDTHVPGRRATLSAELPAARIQELRRRLPGLTHGEGIVEATFDRYSSR
ncbi:GTP-binding protein [Winogradskya humida]|uniref:Elongation factor G n=1 Tax=Winogradskya humida TaxID=113566 RepID=A0ABQ3ZH96_9ACTN|nr:GTP-binding protein [Actinoplanes humidus]GIE17971.1 elongation factor G [Actinoplanes humidus]